MSKSSVTPPPPGGNAQPQATLRIHPPCIDLAERFGQRYRVKYEESHAAMYGPHARVDDPWLKIIPCQAGHICPWGGSTLAAVTNRAGPIARKLAALPGVILWQDGSDGVTILFDVSDFAAVAEIMHPRRCRRLTPEQQERLVGAGARYRFSHGAQRAPEPRPCVETELDGLGAIPEAPSVSRARE